MSARQFARAVSAGAFLFAAGCASAPPPAPPPPRPAGASLMPDETALLGDLRQLTFGGENAEAYWAFDGTQLSFQARHEGESCDRIYRLPLGAIPPRPLPVSSGQGATTCAHFLPQGDMIYASTHLAGAACPPRPDRSRGYVWALYDSYDIFAAAPDGSNIRRLTSEKGYDAEGTVCGQDGAIVFTSVRDGDLELYRMDRDGQNVRRLTNAVGYDGGAFFNRDCTKIVWRASRPRGREVDDYKALLAQGLVRPSKLEIWIADADGSNATQLTYLDAAAFAPTFHPTEPVILFSSNHGDPKGREFDLWAIEPNGTGLRRVTYAAGFDGFPHFSPDGKTLAFSSNRATAPGKTDTNVFLATWKGWQRPLASSPSDRIAADVAWLADPAREGRGLGTKGLEQAGAFLEQRLQKLGVEPAGDNGSFRHRFPVVTKIELAPGSRVELDGKPVAAGSFSALGFSKQGKASGPLVLAGHGIVDEKLKIDDYAGVDVKGRVVVVRRFAPDGLPDPGARTRLGDIRRKAWLAREKGAAALVVVDLPLPPKDAPAGWKPPPEAPLLQPGPEGTGDAGIPVLMLKRAELERVLPRLSGGQPVRATVEIALRAEQTEAFNVVGRIKAGKQPRFGSVIVGAHYDHLGHGGRGSLAPGSTEPHLGADDNASGTAALLELARTLAARRAELSRDVLLMFFSGEESGLLGSSHLTRTRPDVLKDAAAMLNLDMVGRLRGNRVQVLGVETADEWRGMVDAACADARIDCVGSSDGYGASDQAAFYSAGLPVLHFFTGTHADYHKPTDTATKINAAGAAAIAGVVERVVVALEQQPKLAFKPGAMAPTRAGGDMRFSASLGTIPDYAGPPGGAPGVLLAGVRPGGAADKAGMRRGDVLVRLGGKEIRTIADLGFALGGFKPGEKVSAIVVREGKPVTLETTLQEARPRP